MRHFYLPPIILCLSLAAFGLLPKETAPLIPRDVPEPLRIALCAGRWDQARDALETARQLRPNDGDLWLYLESVALAREGRQDSALAALERFQGEYPESALSRKARFLSAELLTGSRRFEEAERLVEELARELRDSARQSQLALALVEQADALATSKGAKIPDAQTDYPRASELYAQALTLEVDTNLRRRVLAAAASAASKQGDRAGAISYWQELLKDDGIGDEARSRAQLALGQELVAANRSVEGRRTLEDLERRLAQTGDADASLADARLALAEAWGKATPLPIDLVVGAYDRFTTEHPSDPRVFPARLDAATFLQESGRSAQAAVRMRDLHRANSAPHDSWSDAQRAAAKSAQIEALFQLASIQQGQQDYASARRSFEDYTTRYPNGPRWSASQQAIADCARLLGYAMREKQDWDAAQSAWESFLSAWPLAPQAPQLHFDIADLESYRARAHEEAGQDAQASWRAAAERLQSVADRFPDQAIAGRALLRLGQIREEHLANLEGAVEAYRSATATAPEAAKLLERLLKPALEITTERSARSGEDARVLVRSRNHESLDVRVYKLDLEAYFRKHQTHTRIEDLDLDLIAPAKRFDLPFVDYAPYLALETTIDLPVDGPGVWAVAVSAGTQRSTTLVVRSDIEILVKASRDEAFVWAVHAPSDVPAEGVRLLVASSSSTGAPSFNEALTDAQGLARIPYTGRPKDLAVLAVGGDHYAADGLSLIGSTTFQERSPRGIVYSDRSAYRPGDTVHWRALHRDAEGGVLTFQEGTTFRAELLDPTSRVLLRSTLQSNAFGAINGSFDLPQGAPTGTWRIAVQRDGGPRWESTVLVRDYVLQRVELDLQPTRRIWFRGETIEIEARAGFAWGSPLAAAPLRYRLPDGSEFDASTDADGRFTLRFDSSGFASDTNLPVQVWLSEENVSAQTQVLLARKAFGLAVELPKQTVLAGMGFSATVSASDPTGEPLVREVELEILKRVSAPNGRWIEASVETRRIRTDPDGRARVELAFDEGGSYVLRASGVDRFANPVSAEAVQFISGQDDPVRLRLLADETEVAVGQEGKVRIVQRAEAGLALVTFERARVLEQRIIHLAEGSQEINFPIEQSFAPGFRVSVARMSRGRLHQASLAYQVRGGLQVKLEPSAENLSPGQAGSLNLQVTDAAGRPLEAEFSIAIVDDALLRAFPDRTPDLAALFAGGLSLPLAPRTSSSCMFRYAGVTREVSAEVLAEAERAEEEKNWKEELRFKQSELESLGYAGAPISPSTGLKRSRGFEVADQQMEDSPGASAPAPNRNSGVAESGRKPSESSDTLIWLPAVRTDANGLASVDFVAPSRSTRWRAVARGADRGDRLGQGEAVFQVAATLGLELRLPDGVVVQDKPVIGVRIIHPAGGGESAQLRWSAESVDGRQSGTQPIVLAAGGATDLWLDELTGLDSASPRDIQVEVLTDSGAQATVRQSLDVRPAGLEYAANRAGLLRGPNSELLDLPDGRSYSERRLRIVLGAGIDGALLDLALGRSMGVHARSVLPPESPVSQAGALLGICEVLGSARSRGVSDRQSLELLSQRGDALIASLLVQRNSDGGWAPGLRSSKGPRTTSSIHATARVAWALGRAGKAGFSLPPDLVDTLLSALDNLGRSVDRNDHDTRAALLHVRATLGSADFAALNRLHRSRKSLSVTALAYTCLALAERDASPMAAELAAILETEARDVTKGGSGPSRCSWPTEGVHGWFASEVEQNALVVLALRAALPESPRLADGVAQLWAGAPWHSGRGAGLALAAIAQERVPAMASVRRIRLTIGDEPERVVVLQPGQASFVLDHQPKAGPVRVAMSPEGGEIPYQISLTGFSRDIPKDAGNWDGLRIFDPQVRPAAPRYRGVAIPVGWKSVDGVSEKWKHSVSQLAFGATADVEVRFLTYANRGRKRNTEPLLLEIPMPAGMGLLAGSFRGARGLVEVQPGRLLVPLGSWHGSGRVHFTLVGTHPGAYVMPPPTLRSLVDLSRMAVGAPTTLDVLRPGIVSEDEYRPTADERLWMGIAQADAGDAKAAWDNLVTLYDTWGSKLRDTALRDVGRRLLSLALARNDAARVVEMFEILKEKDEDYFVPFDEVLAIGAAYRSLGEFERALLIFRATIEETFGADRKVAGTLADLGQSARSLSVLEELWRTFPDIPQVVDAYLALSDRLLAAAPTASQDASLQDAGWTRFKLVQAGLTHQRRFMAFYPGDPRSADAGLAMVSAFLELEDYERSVELAGEFAQVFADPPHTDAFSYTQAVAQWYLGNEEQALDQLKAIAEVRYPGKNGSQEPSQNRDLALYIIGQIHHARRETHLAEAYYERVDEIFSDAGEALASLREQRLQVAELTTVAPGTNPEIKLTWRNLEEATILVYKVDLMTLYLREKDLSQVASVNLAGIAPTLETQVELGGGRDLRDRSLTTTLELADPGAYLVLARAGETFASGLVLVSDLEVDVVEDALDGRVRVEAQSRQQGRFLRDVDVRIVGSEDGQVILGSTDPRGLYVTDGVAGRATVIARLGEDHYAFHRGTQSLGQRRPGRRTRPGRPLGQNGYLRNVYESNTMFVEQRAQNYANELNRDRKGVQIQQVK